VSSKDISDIRKQFAMISDRATSVAERLGPELITMRPRPTAWSAAECLIHLQVNTTAYLPLWREACGTAASLGDSEGAAPFRLDWWGRFFIWFLDPPPRVRFSAPSRFEPSDQASLASALALFLSSQDDVLKLISAVKDLPLDRIVVRDAFTRHIRCSVWSSLSAHAAHHRRHLWQAEQVVVALGR
jgi:hypothetical protein